VYSKHLRLKVELLCCLLFEKVQERNKSYDRLYETSVSSLEVGGFAFFNHGRIGVMCSIRNSTNQPINSKELRAVPEAAIMQLFKRFTASKC
jgi:hypothetical protein